MLNFCRYKGILFGLLTSLLGLNAFGAGPMFFSGKEPVFSEKYKVFDTGSSPVWVFGNKVRPILRFDLLMETWDLVFPFSEINTVDDGVSILIKREEDKSITINPKLEMDETILSYRGSTVKVSYTANGNNIFIRDADGTVHTVGFRRYFSRPMRYSLDEKITGGWYGESGNIKKLIELGRGCLGEDDAAVADLERQWDFFHKKHRMGFLKNHLSDLIKHCFIGLVSSNIVASAYPKIYADYFKRVFGKEINHIDVVHYQGCYDNVEKSMLLLSRVEGRIKETFRKNVWCSDHVRERRVKMIAGFVAASYLPFYKGELDSWLIQMLDWGLYDKERDSLPDVNEFMQEKVMVALSSLGVDDAESVTKHQLQARKTIEEMDDEFKRQEDLKERSKVTAIKHAFAFDDYMRNKLDKRVKSLIQWVSGCSQSQCDETDFLIESYFDLMAALVEPRVWLLIEISAEQHFVEHCLAPCLRQIGTNSKIAPMTILTNHLDSHELNQALLNVVFPSTKTQGIDVADDEEIMKPAGGGGGFVASKSVPELNRDVGLEAKSYKHYGAAKHIFPDTSDVDIGDAESDFMGMFLQGLSELDSIRGY